MSLKQEEIDNISKKLAKVGLINTSNNKFDDIIKYFEVISEVDTNGINPTISVVEKKSLLRDDIVISKKSNNFQLLECSKQKIVSNNISIKNIMN